MVEQRGGGVGDCKPKQYVTAGFVEFFELMGEVTDRSLQDLILLQCETLMLSDGHLADGEVELLDALSAAWRRPVLV